VNVKLFDTAMRYSGLLDVAAPEGEVPQHVARINVRVYSEERE